MVFELDNVDLKSRSKSFSSTIDDDFILKCFAKPIVFSNPTLLICILQLLIIDKSS